MPRICTVPLPHGSILDILDPEEERRKFPRGGTRNATLRQIARSPRYISSSLPQLFGDHVSERAALVFADDACIRTIKS
ncbi:MAG: hypothetical protein HRF40_00965 [Nitrososphaera sp.]